MNPSNDDRDALPDTLHQEAADTAPAFSDVLHHRIMQQVRIAQNVHAKSAAPRLQARVTPLWSRSLRLAAALMFAAIIGFVLHAYHRATNTALPKTIVQIPSPRIVEPVAELSRNADARLRSMRFGYLDRDASSLMNFVARQMDVLPPTPHPAGRAGRAVRPSRSRYA